jgi:hypothetical protein
MKLRYFRSNRRFFSVRSTAIAVVCIGIALACKPAKTALGYGQVAAGASAPSADKDTPDIDPRATDLLQAAGTYLHDATSLSFSADVWEDLVSSDGRKLQSQRSVEVGIRRPDRIVGHIRADHKSRDAYFNGKTLTIFDPIKNLYGVIDPAPPTIDETVDFVSDKFGISMPLADLIVSNLNRDMVKHVRRGDYLGLQKIEGVSCHHLAFVQDDIDWQIWVQENNQPLIRKVVITYKNEDQAPQFVATVSNWNMEAALPDYAFEFRAPSGASIIDVKPATTEPASGE